jgi:serine/threonine-protein kinase
MIDGRGQVLITDFGLAGIAGRIEGGEIRNGTPAYMAPEQFAGTEVSVRSDIYSLGLILHEMFTGALPKEGTLSQAMDPAVERVIQRCLEPDPRRRPASALAVAAALPGGDPLAAALAAGETPSPEMVAAAGENDGISVRAAVIWLALCLAGLVAVVAAGSSLSVLSATPAEFSPDVLAEKARELLVQLGYPNRPQDRASGFLYANNFVRYGQRKEKPEVFRAQIAKGQPGPLYFWYRQSPLPFAPIGGDGVVTVNDPPMTRAGMLEVHLDLTGRLIHLHAVTPQRDTTPQQSPPDWTVLLRAAGIDLARFRAVEPEWLPPDPADARAAWQGAYAQAPNVPIRVEAAAWRGRPIYFQVIGPWIEPDSAQPLGQTAGERATQWISIILAIVVVAVAAWLAWRHWTSGRGDLRGASRLAALVVAANFISWVLKAPHTLTPDESGRIMWGLAMALFLGCFYWVVYVALEPLVRRRWPQSLISWTRLLSGGLRDPLVGGHVLIGVTLGSAYTLLFYARSALTTPYHIVDVNSLLGPLHRTSLLIGMTLSAIGVAMTAFLVYFLLRAVLKNPWIAGTVFVLLFSIPGFLDGNSPLFNGGIAFLQFLAVLVILMRFGLLPMMVGILVSSILPGFAMTADFSTWYSGSTMFAIGIVLALTAYAFHTARAGRALVSEGALEH